MSVSCGSEPPLRPRRQAQRILRLLGRVRAFWLLRSASLGRGVCAMGSLNVVSRGTLRVGARVTFLGGMIPTRIIVHPGAQAQIGEESLFNYGAVIDVVSRLVIGRRCMLASMVQLRCSDAGVILGDDVWIAHGAIIEPGVTIGAGSVVAAGCVVTQAVPAGSVAVGVPARVLPLAVLDIPQRSARRPGPGEGRALSQA